MLSKNQFLLRKRAYFSLFYRWLFVYYNYFMFLTLYRVFTPNIDSVKLICSKYSINTRYFTARNFKSIFNSKFHFLASTGLILYANNLNFNLEFMNALLNSFSGFSVSAFLFNGSFLNFYSFSFEEFFHILQASNTDNSLFFFVFTFFYSNLFILLSYFFLRDIKFDLEDEIQLYNKLISK